MNLPDTLSRLWTFASAVADGWTFWIGILLIVEPWLERTAPRTLTRLRRFLDKIPGRRRRYFRIAGAAILLLACFQAWDREYLERIKAEQEASAGANEARWAPLTGPQISEIRQRVLAAPARPLWIACETVNCKDLADNFAQAFDDPKWKTEVHHSGGLDVSGTVGIEITPDDETARTIRDAIEGATKLKVKIRPETREQFGNPQTLLVIGTKPF